MLVEAVRRLKPDAIHLNARCVDFEQDGDNVRLSFEGGSAAGDALIGAVALSDVLSKYRNA